MSTPIYLASSWAYCSRPFLRGEYFTTMLLVKIEIASIICNFPLFLLKSATLPHSWRQTRPLVWFYLQRSFSEIYLWVQLFPHLYWEKWWKIALRRFFDMLWNCNNENGKQFYHKRQSESWRVVILPPLVRSHYCGVGPGSLQSHIS